MALARVARAARGNDPTAGNALVNLVDLSYTVPMHGILDPFFQCWTAFHVGFDAQLPSGELPINLESFTGVPSELTLLGRTLRPITLHQSEPMLDLYPLTVPAGFGWRRNVAVLFSEIELADDREVRLAAGADWHMAWWCNGRIVMHTFTDAGNARQPITPLDHDVPLSLRRGRNLIGVVVLAGGGGFNLQTALAPTDLQQKRAAVERARLDRERCMREQLRGPGRVVVDCSRSLGAYPRPQRYQSISRGMAEPASIAAARAELSPMIFARSFGCLRTEFFRHGAGWRPEPADPIDGQMRDLGGSFENVMFPLPSDVGFPEMIAGTIDESDLEDRIVAALRHLRSIAANARWLEVFNESEVGHHSVSDATYYRCYRIAYRAANRMNEEAPELPPVMVGGPCPCSFNRVRICAFLDNFAADEEPRKRLDFVSYHQYLFGREHHPRMAEAELPAVRGWLRERGLDDRIPIHVTESGLFPTRNGTDDYAADLLTQAAGVLSLHYWYVEQGPGIYPYQWTWFHPNPRKNMFVPTRDRLATQRDDSSGPDDAIRGFIRPHCDDRADRWTPFGNANRLQARLGDVRLAADVSPNNDEGLGLYALATSAEEHRIAVLLWNYQFTRYHDPQPYDVEVTLNHLPEVWRGQTARITLTRIDARHGNYLVGTENLLPVETRTLDLGTTVSLPVRLKQNGICLLELLVPNI
ncbi:MAG TPA: hypothetical protein VK324_04065 [Tepidisphaeraceae bacterium]|nr:hypothetical protein [Tepidisphaeraceae bacterium]